MRRSIGLLVCLLVLPGAAFAHIGHIGGLAGHDHILAGAAIGIAIAIGLAGTLKGLRDDETHDDDETDDDAELSEA